MKKVLAHGTFDIFHYGHLRYLKKAKSLGDYLIVYVTSDSLAKKYGKNPYFDQNVRMEVISSLKCVDEVVLRDCEITSAMLNDLQIDLLVTTTDYFDYLEKDCTIVHLDRTPNISSTIIKNDFSNR